MAFSVGSLPAFTDETQLKLLVRTLYEPATAAIIDGVGNIIPGIKSAKALPILETTIQPQDDGCGWTASGTTAITQRVLTVGKGVFMDALCPSTLEAKFTQLGLKSGHPEDLGEFTTQIGTEISDSIKDWIEGKIWQGDETNAGEWDGFLTVLDDLGFTDAGDPVDGNQTTAYTSLTNSNIDNALAEVWSLVPAKVKSKMDVVCFLGIDAYDLAMQYLMTANLFHFAPSADLTSMVWPGTRMKLIAVPGLNGTDSLVAGRLNNFFIGTDLVDEEETFDMWYSKDNREVRYEVTYKYGCQIAFPAEVVYAKPD